MAGNYGITHSGDLLVSRLRDGTDLNEIWEDAVNALAEFDKNRLSIVSLLSYPTTNAADAVYQNLTVPSFEEASEFGISKSIAPPAEVLLCGFTRKDYDLRTEFTRFFLREADRRQVDAIINTAMASDNQNLTGNVLRRLFDPTEKRNEFGHRVFGLWNGTDGLAPPDHLGQTFPTTVSHYLASGNAVLDSLDIETAVEMIQDKGYGSPENGSHIIVFANPQEAKLIQSWELGKSLELVDRFRLGTLFLVLVAFLILLTRQLSANSRQRITAVWRCSAALGLRGWYPAILFRKSTWRWLPVLDLIRKTIPWECDSTNCPNTRDSN